MSKPAWQRGAGVVRALVVASATLAILLVCFSVYQYSQRDLAGAGGGTGSANMPPVVPMQPEPAREGAVPLSVGGTEAEIGSGSGITLSLYGQEGSQAIGEVEARTYAPIGASEMQLTEPTFRLRTREGYQVQARADEAILEMRQRMGGSYDPLRGRLTGGVVLEIDRRTDKERAEWPADQRDTVPEVARVVVELEEIEFDLEYARVVIPGLFHLQAVDVDLEATGLEVRFNELQSRVDYLRIDRGGRLELREREAGMDLRLPGLDGEPTQRLTLMDRLRATLQRHALAQQQRQAAQAPPPTGQVYVTENGEVLRAAGDDDEEESPAAPPDGPVKYVMHCRDDVVAIQRHGERTVSKLEAEVLEVFRDFNVQDMAAAPRPAPPAEGAAGGAAAALIAPAPEPQERIVLTWAGRLVVEALGTQDRRAAAVGRARIVATGSPAVVSNQSGQVSCGKLTFDPDAGQVWFDDGPEGAAVAQSPEHGLLRGKQIHVARPSAGQEGQYIRVTGPGQAARGAIAAGDDDAADAPSGDDTDIQFSGTLELFMREVTDERFNLLGTVERSRRQVLERARFEGGVRLAQEDSALRAEELEVRFAPPARRGDGRQRLEHLDAAGDVHLTRADDELNCAELEAVLTEDAEGRPAPLLVIARRDVSAVQSQRTIEAGEELTLHFEMVSKPAPPFDLTQAYLQASAAGEDVETIDWEARRQAHQAREIREVAVKRLQARGSVRVTDPRQELDVEAGELDCRIVEGDQIESAVVQGTADRPATAQLGSFTVSGELVQLDVRDEWAEVPGPGRMVFRSYKDLDGQRVDEPIPISVTWQRGMKYRGRENWADFAGRVHAASEKETQIDCDRLVVEFDDVAPPAAGEAQSDEEWWIFQEFVDRLTEREEQDQPWGQGRFSKEPAHIMATGDVVVQGSDFDPDSGARVSRARIAGPRLSVSLRQEVSKLLIEGAGELTMEDYRRTDEEAQPRGRPQPTSGFSMEVPRGPSITYIAWDESMWYDFSIQQARFAGDVQFKHYSGAGLRALAPTADLVSDSVTHGRQSYLFCRELTADFTGAEEEPVERDGTRFSRLSGVRLRQFQARGGVVLQDELTGFWLKSLELTFERERHLLTVRGSEHEPAEIVLQRPGESPQPYKARWLYYDTETNRVSIHSTSLQGIAP